MTAQQLLGFLLWMQESGIDLHTIDVRVVSEGAKESAPFLGTCDVEITDEPKGGTFSFRVP